MVILTSGRKLLKWNSLGEFVEPRFLDLRDKPTRNPMKSRRTSLIYCI